MKFCDIHNNQGRGINLVPRTFLYEIGKERGCQGRHYQLNPYRDLDYSGYQKTEPNNCFLLNEQKNEIMFLLLY